MNAISYKCPNCGNNVLVDRHHIAQFCSQCGTPLKIPETIFDHEKFVLEHEEKVRQTKVKEAREKEKTDRKHTNAFLLLCVGIIAAAFLYLHFNVKASKQKNVKADQQIKIVQELMAAGDYDRALIEAESIRVAKDGLWDPDYKHYENARKDLIKLIKEKQKE